jgi:hypothetical protein
MVYHNVFLVKDNTKKIILPRLNLSQQGTHAGSFKPKKKKPRILTQPQQQHIPETAH